MKKSKIVFNSLPSDKVFNSHNKVLIVSDENVSRLYKDWLDQVKEEKNIFTCVLPAGESSKSLSKVKEIYDILLDKDFTRSDLLVSFGGGVIGDLSGFVASTYMRGMEYVQIPTSFLSQVDSSIGGKVGVDYKGYKNLVGSFYFPKEVYIDTRFLNSLDYRNIICGLGEVMKYGLIYDSHLFEYIFVNLDQILRKNQEKLKYIVERSIYIKKLYVKEDFYDKGSRHHLNFGHTIGHGIESLFNFKLYNHGEAVILGMVYESYISYRLGLLSYEEFDMVYERLNSLCPLQKFSPSQVESVLEFIKNDKKNRDGNIGMVLLSRIGNSEFIDSVSEEIIIDALQGEWLCY